MKKTIKFIAFLLSLVMGLSTLSACGGNQEEPDIDAVVNAAVQAALDAAVVPTTVTIEADGKTITIEDTEGKTVQQLLDQANIVLNEGDILSVALQQMLEGNVTIQILRKHTVTIVVTAEDPLNNVQYTAVLMGGTVADALAAVGVELADNQVVNYELDEALTDGMEIMISIQEEVEETEATEAAEETQPDYSDYDPTPDYNTSTEPTYSTEPAPSTEPSTESTEPSTESEPPQETERTIVSVEIYEDCDGSGHGVKVITYSDGTQEEVPF